MRSFNGRFPSGPYLFEVIDARPLVSWSGADVFELELWLVDTDASLHYYLADTPKARWAWGDLAERFDQIPELIGRQFVALIKREKRPNELRRRDNTQSEYLNQVKQILAEVMVT